MPLAKRCHKADTKGWRKTVLLGEGKCNKTGMCVHLGLKGWCGQPAGVVGGIGIQGSWTGQLRCHPQGCRAFLSPACPEPSEGWLAGALQPCLLALCSSVHWQLPRTRSISPGVGQSVVQAPCDRHKSRWGNLVFAHVGHALPRDG